MMTKHLGFAGAATIGLVAGGAFFLSTRQPQVTEFDGKPIPPSGLVINPEGERTGDPGEAERDFAKIYRAMVAFRRENGHLPELYELIPTGAARVSKVGLTMADFQSPDYVNSDGHSDSRRDQTHYAFSYRASRPDGSPKPSTPAPGERDVWMSTGIYARRHQIVRPGGRSEMNVTGCEVVLWSDGKVERIKPGDVLATTGSPLSATLYYPGQTGVPKSAVAQRELARRDSYNRITYAD